MNVNYFQHSVNASSDVRLQAIMRRYGKEGYADYFILLEEICQTGQPILDLSSDLMLEGVAAAHEMEPEAMALFIGDCCDAQLFEKKLWDEKQMLTSSSICDQFRYINGLSEKRAEAGRKSGESRRKKSRGEGSERA